MRWRFCVRPRFWRFVLAATFLCFGLSCAVAQLRYVQAHARAEALYQEKVALTDQVSALSERLDYVRTDDYIERVARDELNMILPGDIRYVASGVH